MVAGWGGEGAREGVQSSRRGGRERRKEVGALVQDLLECEGKISDKRKI